MPYDPHVYQQGADMEKVCQLWSLAASHRGEGGLPWFPAGSLTKSGSQPGTSSKQPVWLVLLSSKMKIFINVRLFYHFRFFRAYTAWLQTGHLILNHHQTIEEPWPSGVTLDIWLPHLKMKGGKKKKERGEKEEMKGTTVPTYWGRSLAQIRICRRHSKDSGVLAST